MSRIRSAGTSIERSLGAALKAYGFKSKKNCKNVFGKPDFVLTEHKAAIFCDSAFWHGYRFGKTKRHNFKSNKEFWINKILANKKRDRTVTHKLRASGWTVVRFWDFQIKKDINKCLAALKRKLKK